MFLLSAGASTDIYDCPNSTNRFNSITCLPRAPLRGVPRPVAGGATRGRTIKPDVQARHEFGEFCSAQEAARQTALVGPRGRPGVSGRHCASPNRRARRPYVVLMRG